MKVPLAHCMWAKVFESERRFVEENGGRPYFEITVYWKLDDQEGIGFLNEVKRLETITFQLEQQK